MSCNDITFLTAACAHGSMALCDPSLRAQQANPARPAHFAYARSDSHWLQFSADHAFDRSYHVRRIP